MRLKSQFQSDSKGPRPNSEGFVLAFTIILIMGVTAISVGTLYNGKMGRMSASNYKHRFETFNASDGMMTLLAQELINGKADKYVDSTRRGEIIGKLWSGIGGTTIAALKSAIYSKPNPDSVLTADYLGSHLKKDNYGIQWTGWIIPPISGVYTFFTRSDLASAFYLSTDAKPENIPTLPTCFLDAAVIGWPDTGTAVSKSIALVAGQRYYFEFYHTEDLGFDIGMVGWNGPEFFNERPISGPYLSKYGAEAVYPGKITVGTVPVRYAVASSGQDQYQIFTEAIDTKAGSPTDTAFRSPLHQRLSLKGDPTELPDMMWLKVIHYDFVNDASNPEFWGDWQAGSVMACCGVITGMVEEKLTDYTPTDANYFGRSKIPKPSHGRDIVGALNCGISMWFRDWVPVSNVYNYTPFTTCADTRVDAITDRWKNVKHYDSLPFILDPTQGPETYVFSRKMDGVEPGYFPLDTILGVPTQDPPGWGHNFSFCTELHTTFKYQSGLKFDFWGDDDVWVYINGQLVIDLGGIHTAASAFVDLDKMTGLTYGQTYDFDLFQCERCPGSSVSRMVTNIARPQLKGKPVASWKRDYGGLD